MSPALERPPRVWQAAAQPAFCACVPLMDRRPDPGTQLPERNAVGKGDVAKSSPNLDVKDTNGERGRGGRKQEFIKCARDNNTQLQQERICYFAVILINQKPRSLRAAARVPPALTFVLISAADTCSALCQSQGSLGM